jgi:X-X-X-Leu-X-X-Gly heptad repeat protein
MLGIVAWRVLMVGEVADWLEQLADGDPKLAARVIAAVRVLEEKGPTLGRPLVDRIEG